jgi:hypothetical protein
MLTSISSLSSLPSAMSSRCFLFVMAQCAHSQRAGRPRSPPHRQLAQARQPPAAPPGRQQRGTAAPPRRRALHSLRRSRRPKVTEGKNRAQSQTSHPPLLSGSFFSLLFWKRRSVVHNTSIQPLVR